MTLLTAFDADVLIYAASPDHPLGAGTASLFRERAQDSVGIGSVLLLPEVLSKPMRKNPESDETLTLISLLSRLDLQPLDAPTAQLALSLATLYGLKAADAVHLATAVSAGADRFLTNNRQDFRPGIAEIEIAYPDGL